MMSDPEEELDGQIDQAQESLTEGGGMATLTKLEKEALHRIRDGADVYSYALAKVLRGIERKMPSLLEIGKPEMYTGDGTDQVPYFGAILTKAGLAAIQLNPRARRAVTPTRSAT